MAKKRNILTLFASFSVIPSLVFLASCQNIDEDYKIKKQKLTQKEIITQTQKKVKEFKDDIATNPVFKDVLNTSELKTNLASIEAAITNIQSDINQADIKEDTETKFKNLKTDIEKYEALVGNFKKLSSFLKESSTFYKTLLKDENPETDKVEKIKLFKDSYKAFKSKDGQNYLNNLKDFSATSYKTMTEKEDYKKISSSFKPAKTEYDKLIAKRREDGQLNPEVKPVQPPKEENPETNNIQGSNNEDQNKMDSSKKTEDQQTDPQPTPTEPILNRNPENIKMQGSGSEDQNKTDSSKQTEDQKIEKQPEPIESNENKNPENNNMQGSDNKEQDTTSKEEVPANKNKNTQNETSSENQNTNNVARTDNPPANNEKEKLGRSDDNQIQGDDPGVNNTQSSEKEQKAKEEQEKLNKEKEEVKKVIEEAKQLLTKSEAEKEQDLGNYKQEITQLQEKINTNNNLDNQDLAKLEQLKQEITSLKSSLDTKVKEWETKKQNIKTEYEALFTKLGLTSNQNEEELKNYVKQEKEKLDKKYKELADKVTLENHEDHKEKEKDKSKFVPWEFTSNDSPLNEANLQSTDKYSLFLTDLKQYDSEAEQNIISKLSKFTGLRNAMAPLFSYTSLSNFHSTKDNQQQTWIIPQTNLNTNSYNSGYTPYKQDNGLHIRRLENYFVFGLNDNENNSEKGDNLSYVNKFISNLANSLTDENAINMKKKEVKDRVTSFLPNILKTPPSDINKLAEDFLYYYNTYLNLAIIKSELTKYTQTGFIPKKDTQQKSEIKFTDFDQKVKEYDELQAKLAKLKTENTNSTS